MSVTKRTSWSSASQFIRLISFPVALMRRNLTKLLHRALLSTLSTKMTNQIIGSSSKRKLVVGLGNPGMNGTRHSIGMAVITALAHRLEVSDQWKSDRQVSGEVVVSDYRDTQLVLLRPKLLMNISGVSVAKAASKYSVPPENIVLIHDELDKPLGKLGIKHGGSARGHNGVRSCIECLRSDVMPRLRIGIGRPSEKTPVNRHVLGRFSKEEQIILNSLMDQSVDILLTQFTEPQFSSTPQGGRRASSKKKASGPASQASGDQKLNSLNSE